MLPVTIENDDQPIFVEWESSVPIKEPEGDPTDETRPTESPSPTTVTTKLTFSKPVPTDFHFYVRYKTNGCDYPLKDDTIWANRYDVGPGERYKYKTVFVKKDAQEATVPLQWVADRTPEPNETFCIYISELPFYLKWEDNKPKYLPIILENDDDPPPPTNTPTNPTNTEGEGDTPQTPPTDINDDENDGDDTGDGDDTPQTPPDENNDGNDGDNPKNTPADHDGEEEGEDGAGDETGGDGNTPDDNQPPPTDTPTNPGGGSGAPTNPGGGGGGGGGGVSPTNTGGGGGGGGPTNTGGGGGAVPAGASGGSGSAPLDPGCRPGEFVGVFCDEDGSVHEANIEMLAGWEITLGCEENRFCPQDSISRSQMAAFLFRAVSRQYGAPPAGTAVLSDVSESAWYRPFAQWSVTTGVMSMVDGGFSPRSVVTRADMAVMLAAAFPDLIPQGEVTGMFTDTAGLDDTTIRAMEGLHRAGVTLGCSTAPLRYCPDQPVTRAQMASFFVRVLSNPN